MPAVNSSQSIPKLSCDKALAQFYKRLEVGSFEMLRPEGEAATVDVSGGMLMR